MTSVTFVKGCPQRRGRYSWALAWILVFGLGLSQTCPGAAMSPGEPQGITAVAEPGLADGLTPEAMQLLLRCQDDYDRLQFGDSEALAEQVIAQFPNHPLPKIFMQAALIAEIQEMLAAKRTDQALLDRFAQVSADAVAASQAYDDAHPDAYSKFYLGGSLGTRGLVQLYQGHYASAYHDGAKAYDDLQACLALQPSLYDAELGLGEYEYCTGHLASIVRLFLGIHGDIARGINLLKHCSVQTGFCEVPAILTLARVYCFEEVNYRKALPYVTESFNRYPTNYFNVREVMTLAKGLGLRSPETKCLLQEALDQWDQGWRPPDYISLDLEPLRMDLAKEYVAEGKLPLARVQLTILANSALPQVSSEASTLLSQVGQ